MEEPRGRGREEREKRGEEKDTLEGTTVDSS